jgi:DNA-binding transcriptional ArsR family regulator
MVSEELESLLVSGKELDKKLVAEILEPHLRIDKETCDIRPLSSWDSLKANIKIVLYLIARKAMVALDLPLPEERASATEIMQKTGLKKGTVNPALRKLFEDRIIAQSEDRKYFVPNYALGKAKAMIEE